MTIKNSKHVTGTGPLIDGQRWSVGRKLDVARRLAFDVGSFS
jgi:hypothetical protein